MWLPIFPPCTLPHPSFRHCVPPAHLLMSLFYILHRAPVDLILLHSCGSRPQLPLPASNLLNLSRWNERKHFYCWNLVAQQDWTMWLTYAWIHAEHTYAGTHPRTHKVLEHLCTDHKSTLYTRRISTFKGSCPLHVLRQSLCLLIGTYVLIAGTVLTNIISNHCESSYSRDSKGNYRTE